MSEARHYIAIKTVSIDYVRTKFFTLMALISLSVLPAVTAVAAEERHVVATKELITDIERVILFPFMALLGSVALLVFVWGIFEYIANAGDASAREKGRRHMLYGIIGLVVMASAYAILFIATATVGCDISTGNCGSVESVTGFTPSED